MSAPNDPQQPPYEYGQPGYNPFSDTRDDNINVGDNYELLTRFAMEQNLGHYGYGEKLNHINKNVLFTNLSRSAGETDKVQRMIENITILKRFLKMSVVDVPTGEFERIEEGVSLVKAREIFLRQQMQAYRFRALIDYFSAKLYGTTSTAAGANAELLKTLKSSFLHKEQSIEDKTETKQGWFLRPRRGDR